MTSQIRRTAEGLELTNHMVAILLGTIALAGFFITVTAAGVGARQQLVNATPIGRHDSLVGAVRELSLEVDTLKRDLLGLTCSQASYPSPFCDRVPRVDQAGKRK